MKIIVLILLIILILIFLITLFFTSKIIYDKVIAKTTPIITKENKQENKKKNQNYHESFTTLTENEMKHLPRFYDNCDGDHQLIAELPEGKYTLNDLFNYGFFNNLNGVGIDCLNVPTGYSVTLYDQDNFKGNYETLTAADQGYLYKNNFNLRIVSIQVDKIKQNNNNYSNLNIII